MEMLEPGYHIEMPIIEFVTPKKKVEIMSDNSLKTLVYQINEFLANHKVVDIHYQMADAKYYGLMYSAMIVYESEE